MSEVYNVEQIMEFLPHRYPFLLVDRLTVEEPGVKGFGLKNVTMNEEFFQGHFPGNPVMPGVLQIEAMAQTAGALVISGMKDLEKKPGVYFMSIDGVKFRKPVKPGDQLIILTAEIDNQNGLFVHSDLCYLTAVV